MNWQQELYPENEQPLDKLVEGYSYTSVFRTIAFVGDSLSSGEFESHDEFGNIIGYHDMYAYSWGQYIGRKNGLKTYSFSRGGMTAREYLASFGEANGFWDPDKAAQAYVIALGVNDIYNCNMEIGSTADIDPEDYRNNKETFVGYYAAIVSRYREISPGAKFFFVTFPNTNTPERDHQTHGMIRALYEMAEYFGNAYVIDLYRYGPVYDEKFKAHFFHGGHMSPAGYIFTAKLVDSYIDYIVRHNPADFKKIGFVAQHQHR